MAAEEGDDARTAGRATEPPDPLEDREKRLARPVLLNALPARDPRVRRRTLLRRQECIDMRRLADPRLAGKKEYLSVSREDPAPGGLQSGELPRAPDDGRLRRRRAARAGGWPSRAHDHLRDEAIAASRHGLDVGTGMGRIGQRSAELTGPDFLRQY